MRIVAAIDNRFVKTRNGNIYSTTVCDFAYWQRYLQVFDEIAVFGRLAEINEDTLDKPIANGPNIHFICPISFIGPWQYFKKRHQLHALAKQISEQYDGFLLKVPGTMSSLLWQYIIAKRKPYGVEVIGDPWDTLGPGSVKSILRPLFRIKARLTMIQQCRYACAASYVTEYSLQKRYPPGCWATHYSSIDLPDEAFISEADIKAKLTCVRNKIKYDAPLHICHVGTMEQLYKGQDVLLEATAICLKKGVNIKVSFVGDGKYKSKLEKRARELELTGHTRFLGKLNPGQAIYLVLDSAELYVQPSRTEGLPKTVIEAMARGLPCIATNVGGIPELLQDKYMVNPNDAEHMAERIIAILKNPAEYEQMALRNLQKAREYRWCELNKRRVEFYKRVYNAVEKYQNGCR